ncbi:MAG: HAD-IIIA family hydrolase [Candidatus Aenigmarchaeota archaeon]|nr:HAD-IIIA family hydrolase [Candidatus Aenigmarchaeota archaeon]
MNRAVFLDRDGTITKSDGYFYRHEQVDPIDNLADSIKILNKNFLVIIITNQPVVARGLCSEDDVNRIHDKLVGDLKNEGAKIDAVYFCPHHPEQHEDVPDHAKKYRIECNCRKPKTGLVEKAAKDFSIDLSGSFFIGDSTRDVQTAKNAGCVSILVKTGLAGKDGKYHADPDYICDNLPDAVNMVEELINVKVVILAGGKGERLRPLTLDTPKPLIKIDGKPILEHQIQNLRNCGINKIVLCTSYLSEKVKEYFGDGGNFGVKIYYPNEPEPLGSGGAVKNAWGFLEDASYIVIMNGDSMIDENFGFRQLIKFHKNKGAFATLLVRETDHPLDSDVLEMGEDGKITRFIGRGQDVCRTANSGMVVSTIELLKYVPDGNCSIEDVLLKLIGSKELYGFKMPENWFKRDVGTVERLAAVREHFEKRFV